ncbi:MAG: LLM class flavin-dependent oxidoreductase [Nitrososphaerales archaeon]
MPSEKTGVAFRPKVISPNDIVKFAKVIDQSGVANIFVNDSALGLDCLDICAAILAVSKGVYAGSGVIRVLEHDEKLLLRRIQTLQSLSGNRFVLGIGTGSPGSNPREAINMMLERLSSLRKNYSREGGTLFPKTFIATLKIGIARKVAGKSEGILLNFCSPKYAEKLVKDYRESFRGGTELACYLKVFFSKSDEVADRLLIEEFSGYATLGQYREMFELDGIVGDIKSAHESLSGHPEVPSSLLQISLANPSNSELKQYVSSFREVGISLPCIYPYFSAHDDFDFRLETMRSIASLSS